MRYTIKHTFNTDADTFWSKIFFDPAYNKALFEQHLKFTTYDVLEFTQQPDGAVHRRVECVPAIELPAVAKKVLGETVSYIEDGRFDPKSRRFSAEVLPKVGADKIKTRVVMWTEPEGDKRIARVAEVDSTVKIFGIGGMLETFMEKQMRVSYDTAADFTNKWIADKGL